MKLLKKIAAGFLSFVSGKTHAYRASEGDLVESEPLSGHD